MVFVGVTLKLIELDELLLHVSVSSSSHLFCLTGIHTVEGIAVDWMGQNLYWTDDGPKKTISVAKLEKASQTRKTLIEGKMTHPRAIVVDPSHGYFNYFLLNYTYTFKSPKKKSNHWQIIYYNVVKY